MPTCCRLRAEEEMEERETKKERKDNKREKKIWKIFGEKNKRQFMNLVKIIFYEKRYIPNYK
jgi:hypothetical protein